MNMFKLFSFFVLLIGAFGKLMYLNVFNDTINRLCTIGFTSNRKKSKILKQPSHLVKVCHTG